MKNRLTLRASIIAAALAICTGSASAAPLSIPFDSSRHAIGLDVGAKGQPLYMLLDTGVDPSAIDLARAQKLGLKIDRGASGEASGEGNAKQAKVFPTRIDGFVISSHPFPAFDALAMDMSGLSARYGRKLDGVLGYSFLDGRIVMIDYENSRLFLLDDPAQGKLVTESCHSQWSSPLRFFKDDNIPRIDAFRFGKASAAISLDTGSNGGITLYQDALALPGLRAALALKGTTSSTGARGDATSKTYTLNEPVGFGPFTLPAGEVVNLREGAGSADGRAANIGNRLFAAMKLKILFDYRSHRMTFYGDCR